MIGPDGSVIPLPYDLEGISLTEYKNLDPRWNDWDSVKLVCVRYTTLIFDRIVGVEGD
ncbi:MAG: hypothetical protein ACE15E_16985 [Acidobacteriota bacterium]